MRTCVHAVLADRTTLRLGGPARRLVETATADEAVAVVRDADARGDSVLVIGGGSNLVIADAGFDGTVVDVGARGVAVEEHSPGIVRVHAAAGESWDAFVARAVANGWAGVEALAGIPGRVGAVPLQNVGAYGQEVADTIAAVEVWDRIRGERVLLSPADCGFGYRTSALKTQVDRFVVLAVSFTLAQRPQSSPVRYEQLAARLGVPVGGEAPITEVRAAVLELRRSKGMVLDSADHDTWSAGSFFTNPILRPVDAERLPPHAPRWTQPDGLVKTSAAWLLEQAGFVRSYGTGRVALSGKHPLALTNRGGATTTELLALAREVRGGVQDKFAITLVTEPVLVGCSL